MPSTRLLPTLLLCAFVTLGCSAIPKAANPTGYHVCTEIEGLPYVALSFDGGKTLVQSRALRDPGTQVAGLLALDTPDALLAVVHGELFASEDAGCHWRSVGRTKANYFAEGRGGFAYGWGWQGGLDALGVRGVEPLTEPPRTTTYPTAHEAHLRQLIVSLSADVANPRHLRAITRDGEIFDSSDRGTSWALHATHAGLNAPAIAPDDLDHIFILATNPGASRDGGLTWVPSRGLQVGSERPRWFTNPIAVGGDVVWAVAYGGVLRSTDGGLSFSSVGAGPKARSIGVGNDISDVTGELAVRRQSALSLLFLGAGNDLMRLDVGASAWTKQPLPLRQDGSALVTTATLIPGRPSMLCFGVMTPPHDPEVPEGWIPGGNAPSRYSMKTDAF